MSSYGYIENNKIIAPVAMRSRFKHIGAWHLLTDAQRAEHKWYPCDVINEGYNNLTQIRSIFPEITFDSTTQRITAAYTVTDKPLEAIKREQKERITEARYEAEIAGVELNGQMIETDRISQTRIAQAHALVQLDPSTTIDWKCGNGWIVLDSEIITQIALMIGKHVQGCFSKEMMLHNQIDESETIEEVLSVQW